MRRKRYKGEIYLRFVAKVQHLQSEKMQSNLDKKNIWMK